MILLVRLSGGGFSRGHKPRKPCVELDFRIMSCVQDMGVSKNRGTVSPQIIPFVHRVFHL